MAWDDTPLYEKNSIHKKPISPSTENIQNSKVKFWKGFPETSSSSPSRLFLWYWQEDEKRKKYLLNEIDMNEIIQALRGVINNWWPVIKKYPDIFLSINPEKNQWNWNEIIKFKQDMKND